MSRTLTYREALREGLDEELARDPNVVIMGEEVAQYNGAYKVTEGLWKKWGDKRIVDTPISEAGFIGMGIGASMLGVRPVMELMFWSFHSVAFDQLVNNAACVRYMSGGLINCPIVMRGPANGGTNVGATHSHIPEGLFAAFPGLKVCAPATPAATTTTGNGTSKKRGILGSDSERVRGLVVSTCCAQNKNGSQIQLSGRSASNNNNNNKSIIMKFTLGITAALLVRWPHYTNKGSPANLALNSPGSRLGNRMRQVHQVHPRQSQPEPGLECIPCHRNHPRPGIRDVLQSER